MIEDYWVSVLGIVAASLVTSSFLPQIIRGYRTKKLGDVSYWLMTMICVGMSLWIVYGMVKHDFVIIGANVSTIILNVVLLIMKRKYAN